MGVTLSDEPHLLHAVNLVRSNGYQALTGHYLVWSTRAESEKKKRQDWSRFCLFWALLLPHPVPDVNLSMTICYML